MRNLASLSSVYLLVWSIPYMQLFFPNIPRSTLVNALLTLTGLWHPALSRLSLPPPTEALLSLLGLLHSELSQCPTETLFSSDCLPFHTGYRGFSRCSLTGTPTLYSLNLMGLGWIAQEVNNWMEGRKRYGKGEKKEKSIPIFKNMCFINSIPFLYMNFYH